MLVIMNCASPDLPFNVYVNIFVNVDADADVDIDADLNANADANRWPRKVLEPEGDLA